MFAEKAAQRARGFVTQIPWWAVLLISALILVARAPGAVFHPQMWAEEGIFYHQAYTMGARAIFNELAGYLHLAPRLIAALADSVDPAWVPTVFMAGPFVLTLWVVSRALCTRCPLPLAKLCAFAIVLVPDAGEVLLTTVNIQWVLSLGLLLVLLSEDPTTPLEWGHDIIAVVLCGLTGPFSIVLLPFFLWRAVTRRSAGSIALALVIAVCAVAQAMVIVKHPAEVPNGAQVDAQAAVVVTGVRIAGSLLVGALQPKTMPFAAGVALTVVTLAGAAILAGWHGPARRPRVWIGLAFAAMLAAALYRYRYSLPMLCTPGNGSRYFFAPQVMMLWLLIAAIEKGRVFARLAVGLLTWSFLVNVTRLGSDVAADWHWENYVPKIRAGEAVTFTINPGWQIPLPARPKPAKP